MDPRLRRLWGALLDSVYPPTCLFCIQAVLEPGPQIPLCESCFRELNLDPHLSCPRCAATVGHGIIVSDGCVNCLPENYAFHSAIRLGLYDGKLRDAILRMKHLSGELLAEALGLAWVLNHKPRFESLNVNLVIPVPLHFWRRLGRGYNQAESLARMIAQSLDIPCSPRWLRRIRHTPVQPSQSPTARRENVRGAFRLSRRANVKGMRILLVDDVMTSGATANEASRVLCAGGADQVNVAVLAHR